MGASWLTKQRQAKFEKLAKAQAERESAKRVPLAGFIDKDREPTTARSAGVGRASVDVVSKDGVA